jgi:trehalose 6-phosphate phosphatase
MKRSGIKPRLLDHLDDVGTLLKGRRFGLMADLDGTLAEMVMRPDECRMSPRIQQALKRLSQVLPVVAVVTGRSARDALLMAGVREITYIGNHGMERIEKGERHIAEAFSIYAPELREATGILRHLLKAPGIWLEDKDISISLHYRLSEDKERAHQEILKSIAALPNRDKFRVIEGKMVVNLVPLVGSSKGSAIKNLVKRYDLTGAMFLGDDFTDLDGFNAIRELSRDECVNGVNVAVLGVDPNPHVQDEADYVADSVDDVEQFLVWLTSYAT